LYPIEAKEGLGLMGYCGLDSWVYVDGAADLRSNLEAYRGTAKFSRCIKEALKEKGNAYNPSGIINLALLVESEDISPKDLGKRNMYLILEELIQLMEQVNDDLHDKAYVRLYCAIQKILRSMV
jgi:hypothetical protein